MGYYNEFWHVRAYNTIGRSCTHYIPLADTTNIY